MYNCSFKRVVSAGTPEYPHPPNYAATTAAYFEQLSLAAGPENDNECRVMRVPEGTQQRVSRTSECERCQLRDVYRIPAVYSRTSCVTHTEVRFKRTNAADAVAFCREAATKMASNGAVFTEHRPFDQRGVVQPPVTAHMSDAQCNMYAAFRQYVAA